MGAQGITVKSSQNIVRPPLAVLSSIESHIDLDCTFYFSQSLQFLLQGLQVANEMGARDYFECSAKVMDDNIEEIFAAATRVALGLPPKVKGRKKKKMSSKDKKDSGSCCHCNML